MKAVEIVIVLILLWYFFYKKICIELYCYLYSPLLIVLLMALLVNEFDYSIRTKKYYITAIIIIVMIILAFILLREREKRVIKITGKEVYNFYVNSIIGFIEWFFIIIAVYQSYIVVFDMDVKFMILRSANIYQILLFSFIVVSLEKLYAWYRKRKEIHLNRIR